MIYNVTYLVRPSLRDAAYCMKSISLIYIYVHIVCMYIYMWCVNLQQGIIHKQKV